MKGRPAHLRALDLFDLTTEALEDRSLGRLRGHRRRREVLAGECLREAPDLETNRRVLKSLLLLTRRSARQIPFVCGD